MHSIQWFWHFQFCSFIILALINMTLFIWVTIKICKTTRSLFALTLLSFTPLFATALIYFAINTWYDEIWVRLICECFVASVPIQSWLFAMQYLKSYLYTCMSGDSLVYKIHTVVKYLIIATYITVLVYLKWQAKTPY